MAMDLRSEKKACKQTRGASRLKTHRHFLAFTATMPREGKTVAAQTPAINVTGRILRQ